MDKTVYGWLKSQDTWIQYCTDTQLLGLDTDRSLLLSDKKIRSVIDRVKSPDAGISALCAKKLSYKSPGNAFWDLYFLADIGLTASDLGISGDVERFFELQKEDGTFIVMEGTKPGYFCVPAILLASLVKMGYGDDPHLQKFLDNIQKHSGSTAAGTARFQEQPAKSCRIPSRAQWII